MRPGMQSLLTLLRGEPLRATPEPEWLAMVELARRENILPWTAARLAEAGPWSAQRAESLRAIRRDAQVFAFLWSSHLRSTLAAFHARGIAVIPLKGPWLAERLYGDTALRNYSDLDLLVGRREISSAEDVLSELEFLPGGRRGDYERPWCRGDVTIELHHDAENPLAFDFRVEDAWQRAQCSDWHGVPARLLAPADELLFLCLHGVRHRFERLSHVLDLVLAFRQWPQQAGHSYRDPAADQLLAIGARIAARLDPRVSVLDPPSLGARDRNTLDAVAHGLWQERMDGTAPALDWRAKHQFYLALEGSPRRRMRARLRHLRMLLTRLIEPDFAFAAQFNLRRTWQVWLLRPVRLLFKTGRGSPLPG